MREDVQDLNANLLGCSDLFLLSNTNYISIKLALFVPLGNKNLLKLHPMWQNLIEFYEKNHCLVDGSEWPSNWSWNR